MVHVCWRHLVNKINNHMLASNKCYGKKKCGQRRLHREDEQRLGGGERASHVGIWGRISRQGNKHKGSVVEACSLD